MDNLLRLASFLDNVGEYEISDNLFKFAQVANVNESKSVILADKEKLKALYQSYSNKKLTPQEYSRMATPIIDKLLALVPNMTSYGFSYDEQMSTTNELNEQKESILSLSMGNAGQGYSNAGGVNVQNQGGSYIAEKNGVGANQLLNSVDSKSFVNNLFTFARSNNILSDGLKKSFDVYADAGATVNGTSIKNIPKLQELYKFVINNPRIIYPQEMVNFLDANIVYENNSNDVTDEEKNQYVFLLNRLRPLSTKLRILNEEYNNRKIDYNTYDKAYTENMDEFEIAHNELEAYKAGLRKKYPQYAPYIKAMPLTRNPSN